MSYIFGDSGMAQHRLGVLAQAFEKPTREFLASVSPSGTGLAIDLGCGPGHTTHLLDELLPFDRVVGLDKSEQYVAAAADTAAPRVSFIQHDVTTVPFPVGPADLIFCRFLVPHLRDAHNNIHKWGTQLGKKGLLLAEEVEWIHSDNPLLDSYLKALEQVLEAQDTRLYAGRLLTELPTNNALSPLESTVRGLPVSNHQAAEMFSLNIQAWGTRHPAISLYSAGFLRQLKDDLTHMAQTTVNDKSEIEWGMRQVVLRKI